MLSISQVSKAFAGVQALDDVSIDIGENEVVGLVGENGAGKSTLMRILAGVYTPDRGSLRLDGQPVTLRKPSDANASGKKDRDGHQHECGGREYGEQSCGV